MHTHREQRKKDTGEIYTQNQTDLIGTKVS